MPVDDQRRLQPDEAAEAIPWPGDEAERLAAEALPYDNAADDEAWTWRCRTVGCAGLMHTAGYARERRGLVALCDGCGAIALR